MGYDSSQNTWEPLDNFNPVLAQAYEDRVQGKETKEKMTPATPTKSTEKDVGNDDNSTPKKRIKHSRKHRERETGIEEKTSPATDQSKNSKKKEIFNDTPNKSKPLVTVFKRDHTEKEDKPNLATIAADELKKSTESIPEKTRQLTIKVNMK